MAAVIDPDRLREIAVAARSPLTPLTNEILDALPALLDVYEDACQARDAYHPAHWIERLFETIDRVRPSKKESNG